MLIQAITLVAVFSDRPSRRPPEAAIARLDCPASTRAMMAVMNGQTSQLEIASTRPTTALESVCRAAGWPAGG